MAGNILYIPYTIIMIVGLVVIGLFIRLKISREMTKKYLVCSIPIFLLFQVYFWNLDFNDYVKSYLFSEKSYQCEETAVGADIAIPLPNRTVLQGKQDVCSPFYTTYIKENDFIEFYQGELFSMKKRGEVKDYKYVEQTNYKGFEIELGTGAKIYIFIKNNDKKRLLTVDFNPN